MYMQSPTRLNHNVCEKLLNQSNKFYWIVSIVVLLCITFIYTSPTYSNNGRYQHINSNGELSGSRSYNQYHVDEPLDDNAAIQSVLLQYPSINAAYNELINNIDASVLTSSKKDMLNDLVLQIHREKERRHSVESDLADITSDYESTLHELDHYKRIVVEDEASHLPHAGPSDNAFYVYIFSSIGLVTLGAIMSGLQVGLFSIDPMKLALLKMDKDSDPTDQRRAEQLTPLLQRHHWLLVSLLIVNAVAMEALPIFLDALVPSYAAIIISVTLVLVFGEIIPQALCTRSPLAIGAMFAPFVKLLMLLTIPVSYPVAQFLDYLLGDEGGNYFLLRRGELDALVDLHAESFGGHLQLDQINLMKSALAYGERQCAEVMTPINDVYMLELHRQLDAETMHEIFNSGFSRIPVYDRIKPWYDNIVGLLIAKDLILLDPEDSISVSTLLNLYPRPLERVFPDTTLRELLNIFKTGRTHMAIVNTVDDVVHNGVNNTNNHNNTSTSTTGKQSTDPHYHQLGIITLEDVIEAILNEEISDETDIDETEQNNRLTLSKYLRYQPPIKGLSPQESSAIFYTFINNILVFQKPNALLNDNGLKRLIAESQVLDVEIQSGSYQNSDQISITINNQQLSNNTTNLEELPVEHGGKLLYQRGKANEFMTLVLDGFVEVRAGEEGYISESHRWSTLGTGCLKLHDDELNEHVTVSQLHEFIPDFSAIIVQTSRLLRISRRRYLDEVRAQRKLPPIIDDTVTDTGDDSTADGALQPSIKTSSIPQHIAIQIQPLDSTTSKNNNQSAKQLTSDTTQGRRLPTDRRGRRNVLINQTDTRSSIADPVLPPPPLTTHKSASKSPSVTQSSINLYAEPDSAHTPTEYSHRHNFRRSNSMDRVSRSKSPSKQHDKKQVKFVNIITNKLAQQRGNK